MCIGMESGNEKGIVIGIGSESERETVSAKEIAIATGNGKRNDFGMNGSEKSNEVANEAVTMSVSQTWTAIANENENVIETATVSVSETSTEHATQLHHHQNITGTRLSRTTVEHRRITAPLLAPAAVPRLTRLLLHTTDEAAALHRHLLTLTTPTHIPTLTPAVPAAAAASEAPATRLLQLVLVLVPEPVEAVSAAAVAAACCRAP